MSRADSPHMPAVDVLSLDDGISGDEEGDMDHDYGAQPSPANDDVLRPLPRKGRWSWAFQGVQTNDVPLGPMLSSARDHVKPSFPKINRGASHVELRAGLRFSEPDSPSPVSTTSGSSSDSQSTTADEVRSNDKHIAVSLGLGINTGAGMQDGTVGFKVLGCGLQVGKKVGVSLLDNEISLDVRKLAQSGQEMRN